MKSVKRKTGMPEALLLHQQHRAGTLDLRGDVSLLGGGETSVLAWKDLARFGNETRKGFNIHERDVHRIA